MIHRDGDIAQVIPTSRGWLLPGYMELKDVGCSKVLDRRYRTGSLLFALGALLGPASCADYGEPFGGHVSRSQFFEYHNRVQEPLCPTLLSLLDEHAQIIGGTIGLTLDPSNPYRFYKFRDQADFAAHSGCHLAENGACALGDAVHSLRFFHAHEQAHNYVFRAWGGWSTGLLNEGEAVALSCEPFYALQPMQRPRDILLASSELHGSTDWRDLLYLYGDSSDGYAAAGFFVTYLAERYGWQSVAELHRRVPNGISAADFEQQFAQVYPISMDQAWSEALGVPGASPCQPGWACIATPMGVGEHVTTDCDGELHRSVTVTDQGGVVLSMSGTGARIILRSCTTAAPPSYLLEGLSTLRATHWASLPPGSYTIFARSLPVDIELQSFVPPALIGDTCDSAGTVSLDPEGDTYIDLLSPRLTGWIHVTGGGHTYDVFTRHLTGIDPFASGALILCDDCAAGASCVPLRQGQIASLPIGDHAVVRMQDVLVLPPPAETWGQIVFHPAQSGGPGP